MSNKDEAKLEKKSEDNENLTEQKSGYGNWLFRKKGTAAEPWPTAEELWEDPKVQESIQAHNELLKQKNGL